MEYVRCLKQHRRVISEVHVCASQESKVVADVEYFCWLKASVDKQEGFKYHVSKLDDTVDSQPKQTEPEEGTFQKGKRTLE